MDRMIRQFPHCDQRVLHQPGECQYCDMYPVWQELRLSWGIAFSGNQPKDGEIPCPSTALRSEETINKWRGNRPSQIMILESLLLDDELTEL